MAGGGIKGGQLDLMAVAPLPLIVTTDIPEATSEVPLRTVVAAVLSVLSKKQQKDIGAYIVAHT